ncbi:hypothetical protein BBO01nite_33330 [Brevibacillus borstelensis]|nr:hypothetical protein BBO01nite_33330 [Brevibacillus borstelensis]
MVDDPQQHEDTDRNKKAAGILKVGFAIGNSAVTQRRSRSFNNKDFPSTGIFGTCGKAGSPENRDHMLFGQSQAARGVRLKPTPTA